MSSVCALQRMLSTTLPEPMPAEESRAFRVRLATAPETEKAQCCAAYFRECFARWYPEEPSERPMIEISTRCYPTESSPDQVFVVLDVDNFPEVHQCFNQ